MDHAGLLFDISSAFNTVQPHLSVEKLISSLSLDWSIVGRDLDFLANRTHMVTLDGKLSNELTSGLCSLVYIACHGLYDNRHFGTFADVIVLIAFCLLVWKCLTKTKDMRRGFNFSHASHLEFIEPQLHFGVSTLIVCSQFYLWLSECF